MLLVSQPHGTVQSTQLVLLKASDQWRQAFHDGFTVLAVTSQPRLVQGPQLLPGERRNPRHLGPVWQHLGHGVVAINQVFLGCGVDALTGRALRLLEAVRQQIVVGDLSAQQLLLGQAQLLRKPTHPLVAVFGARAWLHRTRPFWAFWLIRHSPKPVSCSGIRLHAFPYKDGFLVGAGANFSCVSTLKDVFPSLEPVTHGPVFSRFKQSCKPIEQSLDARTDLEPQSRITVQVVGRCSFSNDFPVVGGRQVFQSPKSSNLFKLWPGRLEHSVFCWRVQLIIQVMNDFVVPGAT